MQETTKGDAVSTHLAAAHAAGTAPHISPLDANSITILSRVSSYAPFIVYIQDSYFYNSIRKNVSKKRKSFTEHGPQVSENLSCSIGEFFFWSGRWTLIPPLLSRFRVETDKARGSSIDFWETFSLSLPFEKVLSWKNNFMVAYLLQCFDSTVKYGYILYLIIYCIIINLIWFTFHFL